MRNLIYTASATIILSSCSWISDKSNEWGSKMPVSNEEKRCANSYFCGSEAKGAVPSEYQYQAPAPLNRAPASPIPPQTYQVPNIPQGYPQQQGYPSSAATSPYPSQPANQVQVTYANDPRIAAAYAAPAPQQANQYAAQQQIPQQYMAAPTPGAMPQMPTQAQIMAGQQIPDFPQQGYGAVPQAMQGMPQVQGMPPMPNMPMIPPNPYEEAAKDPRLQSFESNPEWKDTMPESSQAARQFEESQKPF